VADDLAFVKFMGYFNLICYQLEHDGVVDAEVEQQYQLVSKEMSTNMVLLFDREIEKYREKLALTVE
jgi:hypothetical protein